jgi:hypothetical protein
MDGKCLMKEMLLRLSFICVIYHVKIMPPTILLHEALAPATANHPYFVGLALLRSLMTHEEVLNFPHRTDAALDMIALLQRQAPAQQVVQAFGNLRQALGPMCYMPVFRLRRWLEQQVRVQTLDGEWEPLQLTFTDFRRLVRRLQHRVWESRDDTLGVSEIPVHFAWSGLSDLSAVPAQTAT